MERKTGRGYTPADTSESFACALEVPVNAFSCSCRNLRVPMPRPFNRPLLTPSGQTGVAHPHILVGGTTTLFYEN